MNRSGSDIAVKSVLNFLKDAAAVGSVIQPNHREQHGLFEGA